MSTHNICFHWEIKKILAFFGWKKKCLICCYDVLQADIYGGHLNAQHAGKISDDILKKNIFFISCYKIDFDISCKLSPKETSLFFKKIKKNIINLSPVGFAQWVQTINFYHCWDMTIKWIYNVNICNLYHLPCHFPSKNKIQPSYTHLSISVKLSFYLLWGLMSYANSGGLDQLANPHSLGPVVQS